MGLTISYRISTRRRFDLAAVHDHVQRLNARAQALGFTEVGEPYPVGPDYTRAYHWPRGAKKLSDLVPPSEGWIFCALPGDGSESVEIGLCRYAGVPGWHFRSFCKTQYALRYGWEHFRDCHRRAVELLWACEKEGLQVKAQDEGCLWETGSEKRLRQKIEEYDRTLAALGGALKDAAEARRETIHGPIFSDPRFERLEAEGATRLEARNLRRGVEVLAEAAGMT